jgi:uncharacterized MAPEG superfamily protein
MSALQTYTNFHVAGLSTEFTMLAFAIVLGLVQLFLAVQLVTRERGVAWNMGPRDETPPLRGKLAGRLDRAFNNFRETFPFFAAVVVMAAILGRHNAMTALGSELYLAGRVIYVPLYAIGATGLRTLSFLIATAGIIIVLVAIFSPGP